MGVSATRKVNLKTGARGLGLHLDDAHVLEPEVLDGLVSLLEMPGWFWKFVHLCWILTLMAAPKGQLHVEDFLSSGSCSEFKPEGSVRLDATAGFSRIIPGREHATFIRKIPRAPEADMKERSMTGDLTYPRQSLGFQD